MKHKISRLLLPIAIMIVMLAGSAALANNNEYNTTFPNVHGIFLVAEKFA